MKLPAGFEHRATSIARLLGELLAQQSVSRDVTLESVVLEAQRIQVTTPDMEIAQRIATQIVEQYGGGR
jgi:hypothetical protein